jgi:hypothetical protein
MHKIKNSGTKKPITWLELLLRATRVFPARRGFVAVRGLAGCFKFRVLVAILLRENFLLTESDKQIKLIIIC